MFGRKKIDELEMKVRVVNTTEEPMLTCQSFYTLQTPRLILLKRRKKAGRVKAPCCATNPAHKAGGWAIRNLNKRHSTASSLIIQVEPTVSNLLHR